MESIAADRGVLAYEHDEQAALDGAQLISAETDPDIQREQDIFIFIKGNFAAFLGYLRNLNFRDQELLLSYYCLRKTQTQLAPIFKTSQTLLGGKATHSLARLLAEYGEERSFRRLADRYGIHRPEIRRAFRSAAESVEAGGGEQQALGAWIRALIDKANPFGEGESKRQAAKRGDVFVSDDPRIADFRVQINKNSDDLLEQIFAPRGNQ